MTNPKPLILIDVKPPTKNGTLVDWGKNLQVQCRDLASVATVVYTTSDGQIVLDAKEENRQVIVLVPELPMGYAVRQVQLLKKDYSDEVIRAKLTEMKRNYITIHSFDKEGEKQQGIERMQIDIATVLNASCGVNAREVFDLLSTGEGVVTMKTVEEKCENWKLLFARSIVRPLLVLVDPKPSLDRFTPTHVKFQHDCFSVAAKDMDTRWLKDMDTRPWWRAFF